MDRVVLSLPWPDSALNAHAKGHWRKKYKATRAARKAAGLLAMAQRVPKDPRARLQFVFHPPDRLRRDLQNMPSMMKAAIDGIADAMGCDDNQFEVVWPTSWGAVRKPGEVIVIVERSEAMAG